MRIPRTPIVLFVAGAVAAGIVYDHREAAPSPPQPSFGAFEAAAMPEAPPAGALGSAWFCPGAPADSARAATGSVAIINTGSQAVHGTATLYAVAPETGQPTTKVVK